MAGICGVAIRASIEKPGTKQSEGAGICFWGLGTSKWGVDRAIWNYICGDYRIHPSFTGRGECGKVTGRIPTPDLNSSPYQR